MKTGQNLLKICLGVSGLVALGMLPFVLAQSEMATDSDGNGITATYKAYAIFFGLNPTNAGYARNPSF